MPDATATTASKRPPEKVALPPLPELDAALDDIESVKKRCAAFRDIFNRLRSEIGKVIVGQDDVIEQTLIALFSHGHVLLEGVPGLGKTLLVRTLARSLSLTFARIQFTPDLMPADITGTNVVVEDQRTGRRTFEFRAGPIFHQLVLADEINRATPKSQAALLEAMQERSVTIAGQTYRLQEPFFVMATQNPIEQEGTYPLPEAQLDRFFFKIVVPYSRRKEISEILKRTTTAANVESLVTPVLDGPRIMQAQRLARRLFTAPHVQDYVIRLVLATHPDGELIPPRLKVYVRIGASPRAAQALVMAAKVKALMDGRYAIGFRDVKSVAPSVLRHRIMRSFEAEADGMTTDDIVAGLIEQLPHAED
jgi:MoxR-like ATPase